MYNVLSFSFKVLVAAGVGSVIAFAILFTPIMEWIGANSSISDVLSLKTISESYLIAANSFGDILIKITGMTILFLLFDFGAKYYLRISFVGRFGLGLILGAVGGIFWFWIYVIPVGPILERPDFLSTFLSFAGLSLRSGLVGAVIGLVVISIFFRLTHPRQKPAA
jgi:hypothetical protein